MLIACIPDDSFCLNEPSTLSYFATQLSAEEKILAESHIADCNVCCDILAHLTKLAFSPLTLEENSFLDKHAASLATSLRQISNLR